MIEKFYVFWYKLYDRDLPRKMKTNKQINCNFLQEWKLSENDHSISKENSKQQQTST